MEAVAKLRQPLRHDKEPNSKFTLRRKEFKKAEDVKLVDHFAQWLSELTEMDIKPDSFPEDLLDGTALCKLMMRIDGSGVTRYHPVKRQADGTFGGSKLGAFKARENVAMFQAACKRLDLPSSFGTDELESGDLGTIASTLVYVAHAAALRNVGVKELDDALKKRLGLVVRERQEEEEEMRQYEQQQQQQASAKQSDLSEQSSQATTSVASSEPRSAAPSIASQVGDGSQKSESNKQQELLYAGLTVDYIKSLFPNEKTEKLSVAKVASELIKPLVESKLGREGTLVDVAQKENASDGQVYHPQADIVVCFDPECLWSDLICALESANATASVLTTSGVATLWLDVFNLPPSLKETSVEREQTMKDVIERVGRVELVLSPWDKPSVAFRSLSVWEVCCAVHAKVPMFACFFPKDQESFIEHVYEGLVGTKTFQKIFYDVNVERAVSSDAEQQSRVLKILKSDVGTTRVNDAFIIPIKNWILDSLKSAMDLKDLPTAKRSNLYMARGAFHQCLGQPDEAKRYFDKVLDCQQEMFPNQPNPSTASALSNMAATLRELGEFKQAEEVCEKALQMRISCFGESHPAVLVSRAWLGDILLASGEFSRALPILQKVLEDQQKGKASEIELASAMNNLASALREVGKMDEARSYFEQVLQRVEKASGVDHPLYGAALNNCALTLEAQKDFKNALTMHEKSLALRTRALGPQHPDVALSMHNLGVCLLRDDKVKNRDQAAEYGKKAIGIWEKTLGPKHPTVIEARKDWGDLIK